MTSFSHLCKTGGSTLIELMFVLAILGLGISALLETLRGSISYARDTENTVKAINIAREGIESVMNIRDTNWLRFSSDKLNCWNVRNYNSACIGAGAVSIMSAGSYTIYKQSGVWYLSGSSGTPFTSWNSYKSEYPVGIDSEGYYTQTGIVNVPCSSSLQKDCQTIFTREIIITTPAPGVMNVQSIARWYERRPMSVTIETTLSNWKSKF